LSTGRILRARLLAIGEEILAGDIVDSNSAEISRRLAEVGIRTVGVRCVGDVEREIVAALAEATADADLVIATGGLGPTRDDLTRDALARLLGVELIEDAAALRAIEAMFERIQRPMSSSNRVQALVPRGASALPNRRGTAPGLFARRGRAAVFLLPGPPYEMRGILEDEVLPRLAALGLRSEGVLREKIRIHGLPESVLGERIAEFMGADRDPYVGVTVSGGVLTVSIQARSRDADVEARVAEIAAAVEARLGKHVFGRGDESLEAALLGALVARGLTVATAESCTGGRIAAALTRLDGASQAVLGGIVAYSNAVKSELLGVDPAQITAHGAVSTEVAAAMASGVAKRLGVDLGIAVTGIAGPSGGSDEKPVGTVCFGVCFGGRTFVRRAVFGGDREAVQVRATRTALDLGRLAVQGSLEVEGAPTPTRGV
jgi:nicotinamide-nucleotide amidase